MDKPLACSKIKSFYPAFSLYPSTFTDTALEEALYHEFRKYGEIVNINIKADGHNRYASVQFAK